MNRQQLEIIKTQFLTPKDIIRLWNKNKHTKTRQPPNVVLYEDIIKALSIEELFGNQQGIIIFYPMRQQGNSTYGHYVALIKNKKDHTLYFYDSYGEKPDLGQKKYADRRLYNESSNTLVRHLINSGYNVDFSEHAHQSDPPIATCGRWTLMRNRYNELSNDQFNQLVKGLMKKYDLKKSDDVPALMFN